MGRFSDFCEFLLLPASEGNKGKDDNTARLEKREELSLWWIGGCLAVVGFAALLRLCTGLHPYSGMHSPPRFGDYEAQRHWMEITLHLPPAQWYTNSTLNDLQWWGLDYPPLTAYQSYLHALFINALCPEAVALMTSRGYESDYSKVLMRWTVILSDLLIFFPAAFFFVTSPFISSLSVVRHRPGVRLWLFAILLLQPAVVLIDHGHFQYNCISLGFALAAAAAIVRDQYIFGSVLFCLSLNHKHMALYYAPAFFAHLLGRCFHSRRPLVLFIQLGATVALTFSLCWLPFLSSTTAAMQVVSRLFPLQRGLFEDHVANFWCATSPIIKWKRLLSVPQSARLSLATTLSTMLPSMWHQMAYPSHHGFLLAMLNSSLAFFLFSFQGAHQTLMLDLCVALSFEPPPWCSPCNCSVIRAAYVLFPAVHEKSILLPLLPAALLTLHHDSIIRWLAPVAAFSMFPLLKRDGLTVAYVALQLLYLLIHSSPAKATLGSERCSEGIQVSCNWLERSWMKSEWYLAGAFVVLSSVLHIASFLIPAPPRFPYLHAAFHISLAFIVISSVFVYSNTLQWFHTPPVDANKKDV